ncbi:hypothetical protein KDX14_27685 [Burkholderia cenocepacia]|uniref:hypothetical protein n=1 Tax=Burkholderia cepacia complex TaxID=87882 RepID=UPI000F5B22A3|nr:MULTISPECIES: hypothetical protein [Burkholderia cepacia complex]MBR8073312.1 hypothetical protein [Burkholderia cenocepacia]RQS79767.1 hypothetical protein DF032_14440 [Burkholderia seminalis]
MSQLKHAIPEPGISRAVRILGGQAKMSAALTEMLAPSGEKISQQAVSLWVRNGFVPYERAMLVSACTDRRVMPQELLDPALREIMLAMIAPAPFAA